MKNVQVSKIIDIVENSIDQMFCDVLESVDAKTGDEAPDFKLKCDEVIDQLIQLAIQHAKNNL
jgi:hypothetical protein